MFDILVVDDNRINAAIYEKILSEIRGARVVCFADPFAALKWCKHTLPALLVVDYRMPGLDGIQFIHHFRDIRGAKQIPIVMLTAIASPVLWQMAVDAGADAYFVKPVQTHRFLACVERLVHHVPLKVGSRESP